MSAIAFVDATAGCSGDMFLAALVDAGLPLETLQEVAAGLGIAGLELRRERVERGAIAATKVHVLKDGRAIEGLEDTHHGHGHAHRSLADVVSLLGRLGDVEAGALGRAVQTFRALAVAEGRVHGVEPDAVHFHEVGAADALVDIAGTCIGFERLGVGRIHVSPLPWSQGTVEAAHGTMTLPAPATAFLMEGHPTFPSDEGFEQVTPTGAALVKTLSSGHAVPTGFVPRAIGHGAGTHAGGRRPNVLRVVIGEIDRTAAATDAVVLETNLDDATAQVTARAIERALAEGALDAWLVPATMKKGRPGGVLSVLCADEDVERLEALLFAETPTLGIRRRAVQRTVLARHHETVETPWGRVRMKVRETPDGPEATPEYDDARALADQHGVALRRVLEAAQQAWRRS